MKHKILYKLNTNITFFLSIMLYLLVIGSFIQLGMAITNNSTDTSEPNISPTNDVHRTSDSPYLRLPDDMKDWPPVMAPSMPEAAVVVDDPAAVQIYNVSTGNVTEISSKEIISISESTFSNSSEPYEGLLSSSNIETVLPPDDRTQITDTTGFPWRTIVKLYITFPSAQVSGSGAIVGTAGKKGFHVLTAGHCVYNADYGGWATSIEVVPALDLNDMPYSNAWGTYFRSYTGWTESTSHHHDWGVITLDRNIGDFTGWMGLQTADPSDVIYTGIKNVAGYPGDKDEPYYREMWFDSDSAHSTDEYNYWYYMDTAAGQSGGPVWRHTDSDERYILATHAYGTGLSDSKGVNSGTRLNSNKYGDLINWCNTDTPPVDHADLIDDGNLYSGFSPTTIVPGSSFHAWSDVRNIGTAASGGFYVSYYASVDQVITTSDYLIGNAYVSSIAPFNWMDSDWTGSFPSIPSGSYYVGCIVDRTNVVSEFDESNNVAYKASPKLIVNRAPNTPSIPSGSTSGVPGTSYSYSTSATDPDGDQVKYTFNWGDGTNSMTGFVNSGTGASASHTWGAAGTYPVKSMATDNKGASSGWSSSLAVAITNPFSYWNALGGYITSSPSVIVDNQGKTEVWVKGGDNALWVNIDGSWQGKGGVLTSDPFAVKDYNGKVHVLVSGGDNGAWDYIYDPVTANGHWKNLGGRLLAGPTAAMDPTNHNILRVAVKGGDNALWTCDLNINTEAYSWAGQGGVLTSRPYILFDPTGKEHILLRGGDNALWDKKGVWSGSAYTRTWSCLGGYLANGPIATIEPGLNNYVAVFVKGNDNALWMCDVNSGYEPEMGSWYGLGGVITSDPFVVADSSNNKIHTFVRGGDSAIWENIFSTSPWDPNGNHWQGIGGTILTYTPGATIGSNTQAFAIGTDHALWRNTHSTFSAMLSEESNIQKQDVPSQVNDPSGGTNSGSEK